MGLGPSRLRRVVPQGFAYKLRRRFSKLLIALGLVYIGMAISTATHTQQQYPAIQQFATVKPASTVLSANTEVTHDSPVNAQVFIPQCTYRVIPYKTVYKTASWLNAGQTMATGGLNGEEKICSSQSGAPNITIVITPLDRIITSGTNKTTDNVPNSSGAESINPPTTDSVDEANGI